MGRQDLFTCRPLSQNVPYFPFTLGHGSPGSDHFWRQREGGDVFVFQTLRVWRVWGFTVPCWPFMLVQYGWFEGVALKKGSGHTALSPPRPLKCFQA